MNFPVYVEWSGLSPGAVLRNGLAAPGYSAFVQAVNREASASCKLHIAGWWVKTYYWHWTADFPSWQDTLRYGAMDVGIYVRRRWIRKVLAPRRNPDTL